MWVLRNSKKLENADRFGKVIIGNNVVIGAGAVVTKDIPSNSVAVGVPAKVIETIDEYYQKNKDRVVFTKNMSKQEKKDYILKNVK